MRNDSLPNTKTHCKYGTKSSVKRYQERENACELWGYVDCFIHSVESFWGLCKIDSPRGVAMQKIVLFFCF